MTALLTPDFLAIGHITVDILPDGTELLGGSALYAGLTAARFGLRAGILTRGSFDRFSPEIGSALQAFAGEVEIIAQDAQTATVFQHRLVAGRRELETRSWAGPIDLNGLPAQWRSAPIVHLAPVAQEIEPRQVGRLNPGYLGATPQGWMRAWSNARNCLVRLEQLRLPPDVVSRLDAMVLSVFEASHARELIDAIGRRSLVAITRGPEPTQLIDRGRHLEIPSYPVRVVDDTGAGDIFAAVLFAMRAEHASVPASGRLAAATAALRLSRGVGPDAIPTRDEAEAFQLQAEQTTRGRR
jgi:sugar/nucleoside kinase (ribokinase family)